jgi:hypothetical protein
MKKVKIACWIIIFGFVGLVIFQNKDFFMSESRLIFNLGFFYYETPLLANAIFFVAFFLVGILISYFFGMFKHYKDAKTIKTLRAKETTLVDTVSSLENQVSSLKRASDDAPETASPATEPDEATVVTAEVK